MNTVNNSIQIQRSHAKPAGSCADVIIWEWNLLTGKLWTNAAFETAFGYKATAFGDDFFPSCVHPDDKEQADNDLQHIITGTEKNGSADYRFLCADGSYAWMHSTAEAVIENGLAVKMIGSLTKLLPHESNKQETEDWMPFAVNASGLGTWDFDTATGITRYDAHCRELTGLSPDEEVSYENMLARIHTDDVERVMKAMADAIHPSVKADYNVEFRVKGKKENTEHWLRSKGKAYFDSKGRMRRLSGIVQDITEEINDRKEQQMLMKLVENSPDLMALSDGDGNVIYMNKTGRLLAGIEPGYDVKQLRVKDFYAPEQYAVLRDEIFPALYEHGSWSADLRMRHLQTGALIPCHGKFIIITDPVNGNTLMRGVTIRDLRPQYTAQEEQLKLLTLVDNSVDLMSILEMNGTNSYINKAGRKILGIDEDADVSKIPISDFHTEEQIAFVGREILPAVMTKGNWSGRFAARHTKTGEIIPLENNCLRIDDINTGQPIAVGAVMRDLRPEMEAQKEQRRLLFLLEHTSDFVSVSDLDGNVSYVNAAGLKMLGLSTPEKARRHNSEYVMPGETERLENDINKQLFEKGSWSGEVLYRHFISGEPVLVCGTTMIVYDSVTGLPQGRVTTVRDIRAERAAQTALLESEQLFRSIATAMPLILWMSDTGGQITYINQRWTEFAGLPDQPFDAKTWGDAILEEDKEHLFQAYENAMQNATTLNVEYRIRRSDGKTIWTYTMGQPQFTKEGVYTGFLGYTIDITNQKELQRQKDEFIGIASHELKTPVTSLKAYAQLLETMFRQKGNEREASMIGKMDMQINKLSNLISDLLDVTKIHAGKLQFNDAFFDFDKLADDVAEELQRTTRRHTLIKQFIGTGDVFGDEHRIGQVITNFITNAIKYSPDATEIIISTRRTKEEVTLCVQDFGIGIAEDKQKHVFEQFYRVSSGRQQTFPGLGLGLYISAEIIRREGGKIWVESVEGEGSSFSFSLPAD